MNDTLEYLMSQIEVQRTAIIESLGDGSAKTFEDYKHSVGMVRGLLTAQSLISDLAKRMENSDE
jgi:hypothetical protein